MAEEEVVAARGEDQEASVPAGEVWAKGVTQLIGPDVSTWPRLRSKGCHVRAQICAEVMHYDSKHVCN